MNRAISYNTLEEIEVTATSKATNIWFCILQKILKLVMTWLCTRRFTVNGASGCALPPCGMKQWSGTEKNVRDLNISEAEKEGLFIAVAKRKALPFVNHEPAYGNNKYVLILSCHSLGAMPGLCIFFA